MGTVQVIAMILAAVVTVGAVALFARAAREIVRVIRLGQPAPDRLTDKIARTRTMLRESLLHTRMLQWTVVGAAHWFVFVAFGALFFTLVEAYGETASPTFELPLIGGWTPYGLAMELIAALCGVGIATLIVRRLISNRRGRGSRFYGSTRWQAYYVEWTIVAIVVCVFVIRGAKDAAGDFHYPVWATPISHTVGAAFGGLSITGAQNLVTSAALVKILVSMAWFAVIGLNLTMGVAWHRFAAFFNIFFKRRASGAVALGAVKPMTSGGQPIDFEQADPEKDQFGVGKIEDFSWKGLLDFTTCTECGRCQSQCPAWNTEKPLSPKLLVLALRDHAYAKAPYLQAGTEMPDEPALVGVGGVIDPDVLWSCTTCGACVQQCPVDIEHVDHIIDLRRNQVMIESEFPAEAGVMLRNLESKGNPWGAAPTTREDWTKDLGFEVPRAGGGASFEYLYWVGCAGAFDNRAQKTTKAVATLLHKAGVDFAILGNEETCTGDPARRIGNEFLYQMLAQSNVETLNAAKVTKIIATCPHCFNSIGNEYPDLGGKYEVIHHTQLLSQLVADGALTPVKALEGDVTYHDPCYLGRHNQVFAPPRELLGAAAGKEVTEMPRFGERSFCCGAGGARMWMEERIGKRINVERTEEALATGARTVAVACPFCATMLADGVNSTPTADDVEVVDVATVLLRSLEG